MSSEKIFIPFVGSTYFRETGVSAVATRDQYFKNVFLERVVNPLTNKESFFLSPRDALFRSGATPSWGSGTYVTNNCTRALMWNNASTSTNKTVEAGSTGSTTVELAIEGLNKYTATSTTDFVFPVFLKETYVGSTPAILLGVGKELSASPFEWFYHTEGSGALTKISDSDFPSSNVGEMVYLGGYHFIMGKDGRIYNSELNSIANWPGDYISCFSDPDQGVGLMVLGDELLGIGTNSIEIFRLSQTSVGSPLEKIIGKTIHLGASNLVRYVARGVIILKHQDSIYFLASMGGTQGNRVGIFKYDGSLSKISSPELDKYIFSLGNGSLAGNEFSTTCGLLGIVFIRGALHLIGALTGGSGFYINLDLNNFVSYWDTGSLGYSATEVMYFNTPTGYCYPTSTSGQYIYFAGGQGQADTSSVGANISYTCVVQTGKIDFGTSRYKTFHKLRLVGEDPNIAGDSNWSISWSDDDGANFSTARTINQANLNQWISGLGASRRRMFKFSFTADGTQRASRVEGFELEYTIHNS